MISGFGALAGSLASGFTGQFFAVPGTALINYHGFWMVPAVLGLAVAVIMAVFFKEEPAKL
jgi:hypothetical protein